MRLGQSPTKSSLSSRRSSTSLARLSSTELSLLADRLMASRTGPNGLDTDGRHQFVDYRSGAEAWWMSRVVLGAAEFLGVAPGAGLLAGHREPILANAPGAGTGNVTA